MTDAPTVDGVTTGEPVLVADSLVAGYVPEVDILSGTNLELRDGELVGIIGPNGAGKSTLVKALFGLIPVRSGAVRLRGEEVTGLKAHELVARGIGYVPQTENVFPRLTVEGNVEMGVYQRPKMFGERLDAAEHRTLLDAARAGEPRGGGASAVVGGAIAAVGAAADRAGEPRAAERGGGRDHWTVFGWDSFFNALELAVEAPAAAGYEAPRTGHPLTVLTEHGEDHVARLVAPGRAGAHTVRGHQPPLDDVFL